MKEGDIKILRELAQYEATIDFSKPGAELGWEWRDVRKSSATLTRLFLEGYLDNPYKSNSCTGYLLSNKAKELLEVGGLEEEEYTIERELSVPDDLFEVVEGYDDIKDLLLRVIKNESQVHILFAGVPSSAKTMFLVEISRLGVPYILGSQSTKAGIAEVLFDTRPGILLIDEVDRIGSKDIAVLLSLMETGIVSETKHGKQREVKLNTKVLATSNTTRMAPELLSRFMILRFRPYTREEFITVATNVLIKREAVDDALASYIAHRAWEIYPGYADPRQAVRVARLAKSREEVDRVFELIRRYSQPG